MLLWSNPVIFPNTIAQDLAKPRWPVEQSDKQNLQYLEFPGWMRNSLIAEWGRRGFSLIHALA